MKYFVSALLCISCIMPFRADAVDGKTTADLASKPYAGRLLTPEEGCGLSNPVKKRIVGGSPAKKGAYPWFALLFVNSTNAKCGGSLITTRHILTAAHCNKEPYLSFARLGIFKFNGDEKGIVQDAPIVHVENHNAYANRKNDIAILYLKHDVEITDRIRPVCLPVEKEIKSKNFVDHTPFIAGFGHNFYFSENDTSSTPPGILIEAQVSVYNNTECVKSFEKIDQINLANQIDNSIMCAGSLAGGKDACTGDSGGGLVLPIFNNKTKKHHFYEIGIVSYGAGCGQPGILAIYTSVQYFIDWIQAKLSVNP